VPGFRFLTDAGGLVRRLVAGLGAESEEHPRGDPEYRARGHRRHGDEQHGQRAADRLLQHCLPEPDAEGWQTGEAQRADDVQYGDSAQRAGAPVQGVFVNRAVPVEEYAGAGEQGGFHPCVAQDVQCDPVVGLGTEAADPDEEEPHVGDRGVRSLLTCRWYQHMTALATAVSTPRTTRARSRSDAGIPAGPEKTVRQIRQTP
jgi:hypothetical protein